MLIILFRTAILYVLVLLTFRILGKRQVGEPAARGSGFDISAFGIPFHIHPGHAGL